MCVQIGGVCVQVLVKRLMKQWLCVSRGVQVFVQVGGVCTGKRLMKQWLCLYR